MRLHEVTISTEEGASKATYWFYELFSGDMGWYNTGGRYETEQEAWIEAWTAMEQEMLNPVNVQVRR